MGSIKRNWILAGMFVFVVMFGCLFGLGIDNQVQIACAAEISSSTTTWSGSLTCSENITITSEVVVTFDTTL